MDKATAEQDLTWVQFQHHLNTFSSFVFLPKVIDDAL